MNPNFLFHIALPLCAFIAGITTGIVIYRGRLRDALSQLTLTNAYFEAEKELKEEAVKAAETEESLRMAVLAEKQRVFECLVDAVSKMPVPFNMRERDQFGRFRKVDPITIALSLVKEKNRGQADDKEIQRLCDEIRDNAVTDVTPNSSRT